MRSSYLALINRAPEAWAGVYDWFDRQENMAVKLRVFFLAQNRLSQLLARFQPDVVVSVFPAYPHLLDDMFGERAGALSPLCLHHRFDHGERHLVSLHLRCLPRA